MEKKRWIALLGAGVISAGLLAGCCSSTGTGTQPSGESKGTVTIGYVNWSEGIAMTNLVSAVLQDKLGYQVETTMTDVAPLFASLSSGGTDVFLDAWLPVTHESYMNPYGDDLEDLGINYENAKIGLVVPSYLGIDSIEGLNGIKDALDGTIVGIDAGAGIMSSTTVAIEAYGLEYELMPGSGPTMTAALKKAIDAEEPIVVTGWTPHWMFARWDLKFLEDPQNVYGAAEYIHTVARKGFSADHPEVSAFLSRFSMTSKQLGDLMGVLENDASGKDTLDLMRDWISQNEELVDGWLKA